MKDILKLFVFLFFTISLIACKPKPQGKVETVKFTDEYRKNLIDSFRSCGCTVPSYPETPIAPGDSAEMKVVFNSTGKSGPTTKSVTIVANPEPQISELNISANIAKGKKKAKESKEE